MALDELVKLVMSQRYLAARELFRSVNSADGFLSADYPFACHMMAVAEAGLGNYGRAVRLAQDADRLAENQGDWNLVARVGANLIGLYKLIGECGLASERGDRWLAEVDLYPEMSNRRGGVEYNLALVYREQGDQTAARSLLADATKHMYQDGEEPSFQVIALQMLAWLSYEAEDFQAGDAAFGRAEAIMPENAEVALVREQLLLKSVRAFYVLDYEQALSLAEEFIQPNHVSTVLQKLGAVWIAGMVAAKLGHYDLAREMADRLQRLNMDGERIVSHRYANGAIEILRRVRLAEELMDAGGA